MNITPSIYSSFEVETFRNNELKRIGEKNIKKVKIIEFFYDMIGFIAFIPFIAFFYFFHNNILGFFISIFYLIILFKFIPFLTKIDESNFRLYKNTIKLMKKKNIPVSPIETIYFESIYKEHKVLCEIQNFIKNHPNTAFEYNYHKNGWVYLIYNDGNYIQRESFKLSEYYANELFKEDKIDFSYCDEILKKCLEFKIKEDETNL